MSLIKSSLSCFLCFRHLMRISQQALERAKVLLNVPKGTEARFKTAMDDTGSSMHPKEFSMLEGGDVIELFTT